MAKDRLEQQPLLLRLPPEPLGPAGPPEFAVWLGPPRLLRRIGFDPEAATSPFLSSAAQEVGLLPETTRVEDLPAPKPRIHRVPRGGCPTDGTHGACLLAAGRVGVPLGLWEGGKLVGRPPVQPWYPCTVLCISRAANRGPHSASSRATPFSRSPPSTEDSGRSEIKDGEQMRHGVLNPRFDALGREAPRLGKNRRWYLYGYLFPVKKDKGPPATG